MSTQTAGRSHGLVRAPLLALAVVAFAGFALDSLAVLGHPVPGWDVGIERAVQQVGWGPLAAVFAASDWFEGLKQVAAAIAGILLVALLNRRGFFLMVWGALSAGAYTLIEMFVHRPRPDAALVHVVRHTNGWSFPSGHVIFFTWFLAYLLLILGRPHLPRPAFIAGWVLLGVVLGAVVVGRVYTGEHWPSDVLAGLLLGAGWTLLGLSIRPLSDPVLNA
ncbi:MAG TPA: phosphatase PAP2 family protein [Candidatus Dormibacteraeota bacterium]|jgi:undecaprenyl-diphosphatase